MKTLARTVGVCVALGLMMVAASTASAAWGYVERVTVTTPVVVAYPDEPVVTYYSPLIYQAPIVRVPVLPPPPLRIVAPARVYSPAPAVIRTGPFGRVRTVYWP